MASRLSVGWRRLKPDSDSDRRIIAHKLTKYVASGGSTDDRLVREVQDLPNGVPKLVLGQLEVQELTAGCGTGETAGSGYLQAGRGAAMLRSPRAPPRQAPDMPILIF